VDGIVKGLLDFTNRDGRIIETLMLGSEMAQLPMSSEVAACPKLRARSVPCCSGTTASGMPVFLPEDGPRSNRRYLASGGRRRVLPRHGGSIVLRSGPRAMASLDQVEAILREEEPYSSASMDTEGLLFWRNCTRGLPFRRRVSRGLGPPQRRERCLVFSRAISVLVLMLPVCRLVTEAVK